MPTTRLRAAALRLASPSQGVRAWRLRAFIAGRLALMVTGLGFWILLATNVQSLEGMLATSALAMVVLAGTSSLLARLASGGAKATREPQPHELLAAQLLEAADTHEGTLTLAGAVRAVRSRGRHPTLSEVEGALAMLQERGYVVTEWDDETDRMRFVFWRTRSE